MAKTKSESTSLTSFMKTANLPALTDEAMANALEETVNDSTGGGGAATFLSFSGKTGVYSLGKTKKNIDPEDLYILEPQSVIKGWTCWKGNKPVARHEWSVYQKGAAVAAHELADHGPYRTDHGEGWSQMLGFGIIETAEPFTPISYSTTSISGRNAVGDLIEEIKARLRSGEPPIPVISFDREEFEAQGKKNFKPQFLVDVWVTRPAVDAFVAGDLDSDDFLSGEEPKKKKAKAKRKK